MPINSSSIPALRIAREVRRKRRAEGGAVAYDPMSGLQIGGDSSEAPAPDPQGPLSKIASRLTGTQFGEPRYQLWPEKMVRSGFTLPHDVGTGEVPMHVMDQTTGEMVLNPDMIQRAQDMAGMAGGQTLLTGAREAVPAAQRALVAAADSSATGAPVAALERAHQGYNIDAYKGMSPYHPDSLPETNWKGDPVHGTDDRVPREITEGQGGRFYSDDPAVASRFAEALSKEGAVFPSKLKMENPVVIDAQGAPAAALQFESIARKYNMLPEYEQFKAAREFKGDHDGVVVKNTADEGTIYMPRSGEQVRSRFAQFDPQNAGKNGLLLSDSAGPGAPLAALEHAPAFYSGLERAVEAIPQPTMTGQQWLGTLNNKGVKAEEMQWSGLGDYLTAKADQPVSKAEVAEHLGANQVKLGETTLQTQPWDKLSGDEQYAIADRYNDSHDNIGRPDEIRDWYDEQVRNGELTKGPKYSDWQLPGGENYREKLLTMPTPNDRYMAATDAMRAKYGDMPLGKMPMTEAERAFIDKQISAYGDNGGTYKSSHWDEPNILVHRRTNERPYDIPFSPEEQAAAEAHQAARPQIEALRQQQSAVGRQIVEASGPLNAARSDELMAKARAKKMTAGEYNRALEQGFDHPELKPLQDKLQALRAQENQIRAGLPPEPKPKQGRALHIEEIQSDWHQAGRKKGYDKPVNVEKKPLDVETARRVGLNEGDERYVAERDGRVVGVGETEAEARQYAGTAPKGIPDAPFKKNWHELALKDAIREAAEKGLDRVSWTPGEAQAARYDLSKHIERVYYDPDVGTVSFDAKAGGRHPEPQYKVTPEKLADVVGKDVAEKLLQSPRDKHGIHSLGGLDLKVGGEGMKGFYDKIIPDAMNKIGKPHGAKVQRGESADTRFGILHNDKTVSPGNGFATAKEARDWALANGWQGKGATVREIQSEMPSLHYMDIPQSLKDQALKKGFSLFEDSATPGAAVSAAEAAAKERALVDELWHGISNVRLPKPIREMSSSHQPIKGQQARERVMRPSDMQGGLLYPLVGDRTVAGSRLKRVNGFKFSDPVEMQGGHGFMAANADTGAAWASGQGVVKRLSNAVRNLAKGEKPVYGVYTAMGERSADFSHHVSDTLTEMLKHTKVARDGKAAFDEAMRGQAKGFDAAADWPGVGSKKLREYLANAPGAVRNKFAKLMDTRKFQDLGFPSVAEARHAVTDPRLLNEPTGASGLSISRLDPAGRMFKSASQHRSYDTNLGGQYAGGLGMSVPKEVMYPEIVSSLEGYRDKLPGYKPTIDYLMTRTPTGQPTVQHATQQWVDNISKYLQDRGVPGMKAGGSVDAAMDVARCIKRAKGGKVHVGPILGDTDGRADEVPMEVPDGAYVLTADHCSSMGEGNTLSGFKKLNEMFPKSAQARTAKKEPIKRAAGGKVPIYAADGEYVICPEDIVERWGDLDRGHRILDAWQTAERKEHVKTLKGLAPPAQD